MIVVVTMVSGLRSHHTPTRSPGPAPASATARETAVTRRHSSEYVYESADPTAAAPVPRRPPDPQMIAAVLLTALLVAGATGWSIPSIRHRLERWRPPRESEEWIA